jgi:hypothetical protein
MGIYQQAVVAEKRVAQDRVLAGLISSTLRRSRQDVIHDLPESIAARESIEARTESKFIIHYDASAHPRTRQARVGIAGV